MNTDHQLRRILREYWGFDDFLPLQREAMECVLSGRDSVVVLPTGGGKSLCFQVPALCLDRLTVVVSPLISLMKDQVDGLQADGIRAACINSLMALDERKEVADQIRAGRLRLLYVAPERLLADRTLDFLQSVGVAFFAIDEAHCISSWGHDFRPDYRELSQLRERFPKSSIHAFTATATERVRRDIATQLGLANAQFLVGSFDRANLVYRVERRANILAQIRAVIDRFPRQSGIVYCISRNDVEETSDALNELGYLTLPYHAGLPDGDRHRNQDAFTSEKVDTIVATVAFGMGIDKSNVRYVIHAGMPKSLEAYQQESGRAGRDGLEAECVLFYSGADLMIWKKMMAKEDSPAPGAKQMLEAMYGYCTGAACRHRMLVEHFGQQFDRSSCEACDVCLGELEEIEDSLIVAQKILSCVLRVGERFGADYVSQVLCGSRDQRVLKYKHDELSTYGILTPENKKTVRDWTEQLVSQRFIEKTGEYAVLRVTDTGRRLLRGEIGARLMKPAETQSALASAFEDGWDGVDRALFERLREIRRDEAERLGVPNYVVFGDSSLRDMARRRPTSAEHFGLIHGVGEKKQCDFGPLFTTAIADFCRQHELTTNQQPAPKSKPSAGPGRLGRPSKARRLAFELFERGQSIDQVAAQVDRARSTTVQYLVEYINLHGITEASPWVDVATSERIAIAIHQVGSVKPLTPIRNVLGDEITYDAIRIVASCQSNAGNIERQARNVD